MDSPTTPQPAPERETYDIDHLIGEPCEPSVEDLDIDFAAFAEEDEDERDDDQVDRFDEDFDDADGDPS